jgi:hypothetical protein
MFVLLLCVFSCCALSANSDSIIGYPETLTVWSASVAAKIVWEVTLFEHIKHVGRQITIGSNTHFCSSLNDTKLCTWGDGGDCIPASNTVSSIKFQKGSCVNVYRDLFCNGIGTHINRNTDQSYNLLKAWALENTIGSLSSCSYDECEFLKWSTEDLHSYLDHVSPVANANASACIDELLHELGKSESDFISKNITHIFFGHAIDERYAPEEISYLRSLAIRLKHADASKSAVLDELVDPHNQLSSLSNWEIRDAIEIILKDYAEEGHSHRELRQFSSFPDTARLRSGDQVQITYQTIGMTKVQTKLKTVLKPSPFNQSPCVRTTFHSGSRLFINRMKELEYLPGKDDRGHLIASCLGGTAQIWNLAPQAIQLNRGNGGWQNWRKVEINIRKWLLEYRCNFVKWELNIAYRGLSPRAKTFTLKAEYWTEKNNTPVKVTTELLTCNNIPQHVQCMYRNLPA